MARGDKNYSERTHSVVDKSSDAKQKEVWDMVGAKKKLHDMVEALINSDSKAAAAALHDYLQVKTRAILGETDHEDDGEEMVAGRSEEDGEGEHEDGECAECGMDPCECEDHEEHDDEDSEDGEEHEHEEHDDEKHGMFGEGADGSKTTRMKKLPTDAKDLEQKVKGNVKFKTHGKAKLTKPFNNAAPCLDRKVKGNVKF